MAGQKLQGRYIVFGRGNCLKPSYAWMDENGKIHLKCPYCGAKTDAEVSSRRCVSSKTYAPEGQILLFTIDD